MWQSGHETDGHREQTNTNLHESTRKAKLGRQEGSNVIYVIYVIYVANQTRDGQTQGGRTRDRRTRIYTNQHERQGWEGKHKGGANTNLHESTRRAKTA
jgi:hypothetical protein